jgi:hypothetical protein
LALLATLKYIHFLIFVLNSRYYYDDELREGGWVMWHRWKRREMQYKVSVRKPEEKRSLGRPRHR